METIDLRMVLRPMWWIGAALMTADAVTTWLAFDYAASLGLEAREGNPIAVWAVEHLGVTGMCVLKALIGIVMVHRLTLIADRGHRIRFLNRLHLTFWQGPKPLWQVQRSAVWMLALTLLVMGLVVGNNIRALIFPTIR